jgi:hypothetical protein
MYHRMNLSITPGGCLGFWNTFPVAQQQHPFYPKSGNQQHIRSSASNLFPCIYSTKVPRSAQKLNYDLQPINWLRVQQSIAQFISRHGASRVNKNNMARLKLLAGICLATKANGLAVTLSPRHNEPGSPSVDLGYSKYHSVRLPGGVDQFLGM